MGPGLARPWLHKTTYAPMICTSLCVRFWIWADRLRGEVGGGVGAGNPAPTPTSPRTVMGKHPDFMVAHPTPTIFRPLVEIFEISYFFAKNFEKV
jgi:hypothetical protein